MGDSKPLVLEDTIFDEAIAHPVFGGIERSGLEVLRSKAELIKVEAGHEILVPDNAHRHLMIVVRGEVSLGTREHESITALDAPIMLAPIPPEGTTPLTFLLAKGPVEIIALRGSDLDRLIAESPAFRQNLMEAYGQEIQRGRGSFLDHPVNGPFLAEPYEMFLLLVDHRASVVDEIFPPSLSALPGSRGRYILTFNFFNRVFPKHGPIPPRAFSYNETASFFPCLSPSFKPAVFCPEIYPDSPLAITVGRELYGFPKRFGLTMRHERKISLALDGSPLLEASWDGARPIELRDFTEKSARLLERERRLFGPLGRIAGWFLELSELDAARRLWPAVDVFVRHKVSAPTDSPSKKIDQLVQIPFHLNTLESLYELEGCQLKFFDGRHILGGKCLAAFTFRIGFEFGHRRVWADYTRKRPRRRPSSTSSHPFDPEHS